jgi:hypothetical protein
MLDGPCCGNETCIERGTVCDLVFMDPIDGVDISEIEGEFLCVRCGRRKEDPLDFSSVLACTGTAHRSKIQSLLMDPAQPPAPNCSFNGMMSAISFLASHVVTS